MAAFKPIAYEGHFEAVRSDATHRLKVQMDAARGHLDLAHYLKHFENVPGGDFIGVYPIATLPLGSRQKRSYYGLVHADVVGKGLLSFVRATLLDAHLRHEFASLKTKNLAQIPKLIITVARNTQSSMELNHQGLDRMNAAALWMGIAEVSHGGRPAPQVRLDLLNFGMPYLAVRRGPGREGKTELLREDDRGIKGGTFLLTAPEDAPHFQLTLKPGDLLVGAGDGVTEARSGNLDFFGEKIDDEVRRGPNTSRALVAHVVRRLRTHVSDNASGLADDASLFVLGPPTA